VKKLSNPRSLIGSILSLAILLGILGSAFYLFGRSASAAGSGPDLRGLKSHFIKLRPVYIYAGSIAAGKTFKCQSNKAAVRCYGPQQIRTAYSIQQLLNVGITGKGQTIVIIDAFQSPTIQHDLTTFDKLFGLNDTTLNIIAPNGLTPFDPKDPTQVGFAGEITLDVEWAHAIAPDAIIDLVLAKSNADVDILSVTKYAVDHDLGSVISQSFGEAEACIDPKLVQAEHLIFQEATTEHITLLASAGDQGAAEQTCDGSGFFLSTSSPASDPLVTAVGGTKLNADATTGAYSSEVAWNESGGASGGGFSVLYPQPDYQKGVSGFKAQRGVPDVAYDGDPNGGVLAVFSSSGQGNDLVFLFGGTSAGSPQWAGIVALANQLAGAPLGFLNTSIYQLGLGSFYSQTFHDITSGNNTFVGKDAKGKPVKITGFNAGKGWDAVTGWGTPNVTNLVLFLVAASHSGSYPTPVPPPSPTGVPTVTPTVSVAPTVTATP